LDVKLNRVLKKQEYEYLQAYNIYVKRKEKELEKLIRALDSENSNNNFKEMRISQLEVTIDQMRKDAFAYEQKQE
jgi:exonuclease VII large subunit